MTIIPHPRESGRPHPGIGRGAEPLPARAGRHNPHSPHEGDARAVVLRPGPQGPNQIGGDPVEQFRRARRPRETPEELAVLALADQIRRYPGVFRPVLAELMKDVFVPTATDTATAGEACCG